MEKLFHSKTTYSDPRLMSILSWEVEIWGCKDKHKLLELELTVNIGMLLKINNILQKNSVLRIVSMTKVVNDRSFVRGSVVPFEEDLQHEFKGHRTISIQDRLVFLMRFSMIIFCALFSFKIQHLSRLPVGVKPHHSGSPGGLVNTRQQWSKYICGMINSGLGGVLYGGIFDNGEVNGFMMSPYQRVHVALQLQEVLQRFQPPVPPELVSVQFVPVREPFDPGVKMVLILR